MIKKEKGGKGMKRIKKFNAFVVALLMAILMPALVFAEPAGLTLPSTVDLSDLYPYAAAIVTALVGLIVIRKAIKLTNRS